MRYLKKPTRLYKMGFILLAACCMSTSAQAQANPCAVDVNDSRTVSELEHEISRQIALNKLKELKAESKMMRLPIMNMPPQGFSSPHGFTTPVDIQPVVTEPDEFIPVLLTISSIRMGDKNNLEAILSFEGNDIKVRSGDNITEHLHVTKITGDAVTVVEKGHKRMLSFTKFEKIPLANDLASDVSTDLATPSSQGY